MTSTMTSARRIGLCAFLAFIVLSLNLQSHAARAGDTSGAAPLTLAMIPAPVAAHPLAQPAALLCGNVWVKTDYVLSQNCMKACLNQGHSAAECQTKYVPLCRGCWARLIQCSHVGPPATRCANCTERYAACMRTFF
jgi:hypothetical protein